ncbi:endonuclease III domain-containing protein [Chloroflexota bacterium]
MDKQSVKQQLQDIYHRLFSTCGPQHWWPAEEPFEVMVGAILTQSAAWLNVEKAIANLKTAGALSPQSLRRLNLEEIATLIRPSGYYNVKARKLKSLVHWLGESYQDSLDKLFAQNTVQLRQELLSVYGIGEETADSIILYAANQPIFVIAAP